jgi:hypothetical protein
MIGTQYENLWNRHEIDSDEIISAQSIFAPHGLIVKIVPFVVFALVTSSAREKSFGAHSSGGSFSSPEIHYISRPCHLANQRQWYTVLTIIWFTLYLDLPGFYIDPAMASCLV